MHYFLSLAWERLGLPSESAYDNSFSYISAVDFIVGYRDKLVAPVYVEFAIEELKRGMHRHLLEHGDTVPLCGCGRFLIPPTRGRYWLNSDPQRIIVGNGPGCTRELVLGPHGGDISSVYFTLRVSEEGRDPQLVGVMQPHFTQSHPPLMWPAFMIKGGESRDMKRTLSILHGEIEREGGALAKHRVGDVTVPVCFIESVDLVSKSVVVWVDRTIKIFNKVSHRTQLHTCTPV